MSRYITRAEKEAAICMAACIGFTDTLIQSDLPVYVGARDDLIACMSAAQNVLEAILRGVAPEQIKAVMRYANNSELTVVPKLSPAARKEYYIISSDVFARLMDDTVSYCTFCVKDESEVAKCQLRRDMIAAGIVNKTTDCPFQG